VLSRLRWVQSSIFHFLTHTRRTFVLAGMNCERLTSLCHSRVNWLRFPGPVLV